MAPLSQLGLSLFSRTAKNAGWSLPNLSSALLMVFRRYSTTVPTFRLSPLLFFEASWAR
jgi:hypothetical protein